MQISINYDCCREEELEDKQKVTTLAEASLGKEYIVKKVDTNDPGMVNFLFTLGCYEGEKIALISILAGNYVINIKNARYSIDSDLAKAIKI